VNGPTERAADRKAHGRSKITHHVDLLPGMNGNSGPARRFRDLVNNYLADMGGVELCSEIKIGLLRRLASTTVLAEMLEARMIEGQAIDVNTLCLLASTCMRLSSRLGLQRVSKPLPGLHDQGGLLDQIAQAEPVNRAHGHDPAHVQDFEDAEVIEVVDD
jgi:hypothetical protein